MGKTILKRILQAVPMLVFISIVSFLMIKLAPGDPMQAFINPKMSANDILRIKHNLGLDKPIYFQYFYWISNILKGDFGYSLINSRPVLTQILERMPATLGLMGTSLVISVVLGCVLGLSSGVNKNKVVDKIITFLSYIGISIPGFWFAMILIYIFALKLHLLPSVGMHTIGVDSTFDVLKHGIMPCLVLSVQNLAVITRYVRENTITQLKQDYVIVAKSKGLTMNHILYKNILKNALLPVITIIGMSLPELVSGAFITETVFGWPGMGRLGISAIFSYDYPIIMAITMVSSLLLIFGNMLSDVMYSIVDPRIRDME